MSAKLVGRAVLVSAMTVTLVPMLGASPAFACKCVMSSDQEQYHRADVVFKAKLRKATPPTSTQEEQDGSGAPRIYEFAPNRVYKGKVTNPQRVSTAMSSATCGVQLDGQGPFLVFAYKREAADRKQGGANAPKLGISSCGGTREVGAKEKLSFGPGKGVKATKPAKPAAAAQPTTPHALQPTVARSQTAVPDGVALPLVAGMLALSIGAAAWATRTGPGNNRRTRP